MQRQTMALLVALLAVIAGCTGGGSNGAANGGGDGSLGLAVGGAQDANAFRENVDAGYVPQPTDVTYEGLFHDYYFDTGASSPCDSLFCPSYSRAVSEDPLSGATEHYLTVGLNSGVQRAEFDRPPVDLVVVVDTSGSMSAPFREYYYDGPAENRSGSPETTTKMAAARRAVKSLVGELRPGDRLGIVAYESQARVVHPVTAVDEAGRGSFDDSVDGLQPGGGTNLDAGMRTARLMLEDYAENEGDREARIIYVTDAMPNTGDTGSGSLADRLGGMAEEGIHTTFVGVGVDFNTRLVDAITSTRGANYYSVDSAERFEERMGEEFEHMVTPLVYDLSVTVDSSAYEIEQVYGSPSADEATGEVMSVKTLFPSRREDGKTEGGIVLLGLERTGGEGADGEGAGDGGTITLTAEYETPDGETHETTRAVEFSGMEPGTYENTGIRKAIALSRYANLMRNWAAYERAQAAGGEPDGPAEGIEPRAELGEWEQRSVDLRVSPVYRERFARFSEYFAAERSALGDDDMIEDLAIVEKLAEYEEGSTNGETNATATETSA